MILQTVAQTLVRHDVSILKDDYILKPPGKIKSSSKNTVDFFRVRTYLNLHTAAPSTTAFQYRPYEKTTLK